MTRIDIKRLAREWRAPFLLAASIGLIYIVKNSNAVDDFLATGFGQVVVGIAAIALLVKLLRMYGRWADRKSQEFREKRKKFVDEWITPTKEELVGRGKALKGKVEHELAQEFLERTDIGTLKVVRHDSSWELTRSDLTEMLQYLDCSSTAVCHVETVWCYYLPNSTPWKHKAPLLVTSDGCVVLGLWTTPSGQNRELSLAWRRPANAYMHSVKVYIGSDFTRFLERVGKKPDPQKFKNSIGFTFEAWEDDSRGGQWGANIARAPIFGGSLSTEVIEILTSLSKP